MAVAKEIETPLGSYSISTLFAFFLAACCILAVASGRISLYLQRRKVKKEHGCKPPPRFPLKDILFGTDQLRARMKAAKERKLLEFGKSNFRRMGNTWCSNLMGQSVIMTIDPQNIKTVLSLKFEDYGIGRLRQKAFGQLFGKGIFTTDGEPWAHSRAMIRPNFTRSQVADLAAFERHIQTLFQILPNDGSTVDLQELFFMFTIDSATEFLFGQSTDSLNATLKGNTTSASDFAKAFNEAQDFIAQRGRIGRVRFLWRDRSGDDAIRICHEFVDQFVDEAVQYREKLDAGIGDEKDQKYVFLHELAKATTDKRRLRDELLNVLLAGRDTTASLLSNMWFVLARHPEIYAKLKKEVDETLNGDLPTYDILRNMKYLKYCMNESLRLHPVVPINSRIAYNDTILPTGGGPDGKSPVFVKAGTIVPYWTYVMHRREDLFGPDAEEFVPERWETLRPGWEYLPFNGGPRICLGQQYALTEAGYVTVRLIQQFERLESRDPEPWMESLTLTLCSWNGTKVGLIPK